MAASFAVAACAAQPASADDLCVGVTSGCVSAYNYSADAAGLQQALDDSSTGAHPADDNIHVAPGVYDSATGFSVTVGSGQTVAVFGSGSGQTILRASGLATDTLTIGGGLSTAVFENLTVESNAESVGATAVTASGPTDFFTSNLRCRAVDCTAFELDNVGGRFDNGVISADAGGSTAIDLYGTTSSRFTSDVTRIRGFDVGVRSEDRSALLRTVTVDLGGIDGAVGASLDVVSASSRRSIDLVDTTIIGEGSNQAGVVNDNHSATVAGQIYVRSTAIDLAGVSGVSFDCNEFGGGDATLTTINSAYNTVTGSGCAETVTAPINITASPARYVDRAARDLRPLWGSSLIEAGEPISGASTSYSSKDLNGRDRSRGARYDIGAFEYQFTRPVINGDIHVSRTGFLGNLVTASVDATDDDLDPLTYAWVAGATPLSSAPTMTAHLSVATNCHSGCKVTVTDPSGLKAQKTFSLDENLLQLIGRSGTRKTLRVSRSTKFAVSLSRPKGAAYEYSSNADVPLKVTFTQIFSGRVVKRNGKNRCDVSGKTRRGSGCDVRRKLRKLVFRARVKARSFWIKAGGMVGKTRLKPGLYDVFAEASLAGHTRSVWLRMRVI